jgi:peptidyl-tRNA hydrolase
MTRAMSLNHNKHGRKIQNSRTEDPPKTMIKGPHEIMVEVLRETMTEVHLPSTVTRAMGMRQIGPGTETGTIEGEKTVTQGQKIAGLIMRNQAQPPREEAMRMATQADMRSQYVAVLD